MKKLKKFFNQRGQTAVFFALLLPAIILFLFVVFDLGWLYLNKSRLQNAAEAAAIAGANKFCAESSDGYNSVMLIYEQDNDFKTLRKTENELPKLTSEINSAAKESWEDNLGVSADAATDSWTKVAVSPTYTLYGEEGSDKVYYEVELQENVTHIFKVLDDIFTTVPAVAVAEISKKVTLAERSLFEDVLNLAETQTIGNWEEQNKARQNFKNATAEEIENGVYFISGAEHRNRLYYDGKWNHFQDIGNSTKAQVHYTTGEVYRYENIEVGDNKTDSTKKSTVRATDANGNNIYIDDIVDSLNIDFKQDVNLTFSGILTDDWDIGFDLTGTGITRVNVSANEYRDNWGTSEMNLRIHVTANFNHSYETRKNLSETAQKLVNDRYKNSGIADSADADPLYVRIESEPMVSDLYGKPDQMPQLNSVRQIILNINETNIDAGDDEHTHTYTYRPLVIFYNGPEKNDEDSARVSQPVIVNLKADFRGILFMPNSPVVLNGNGHKFQGFVIAKEFRKLKTESDYFKVIREVDGKEIYFEKVGTPQTSGTGNKIMVRKPDTDDWFQVNQSELYYKDTYRKITVNDDLIDKNIPYVVKRTKTINANKLDNYDTTTYYRQKGNESRTPAYVRKNLKLGEIVDDKIANDVDIIKGTFTNWYEVKDQNGETYSIRNKNSNFLFYKDGWRIITDEDNQQYIININSKTDEVNDFIEISDYLDVVDAEGKTAYISNCNYFVKKSDAEPLMLDRYGNVQYTDKLTSEDRVSDESRLAEEGKSPVFNPSTFGLNTNANGTHYSNCGAVPKRKRYKALDKITNDGDYCQDMFFETERAKYII